MISKYQQSLENIKEDIHYIKSNQDIDTLQELIDKLNEIYKYVPDIDNLVKWCKADKLQVIGKEIIEEGSKMKGEVIDSEQ